MSNTKQKVSFERKVRIFWMSKGQTGNVNCSKSSVAIQGTASTMVWMDYKAEWRGQWKTGEKHQIIVMPLNYILRMLNFFLKTMK